MPMAAHCSECGTHVWVSAEGACPNGHPRACLRSLHETDTLPASNARRTPTMESWQDAGLDGNTSLPAASRAPVTPQMPHSAATPQIPYASDAGTGPAWPGGHAVPGELAGTGPAVLPSSTDCVGRRVVAFVIDAALASATAFFVLLTLTIVGTVAFGPADAESLSLNLGMNVVNYCIVLGYFVAFEAFLARTPGKMMLGLRVLSENGRPVSLGQALGRNLARFVDMLFFCLPAALSISGSSLRQRLGDKWAGTVVIRG